MREDAEPWDIDPSASRERARSPSEAARDARDARLVGLLAMLIIIVVLWILR
jgi:hypothetical protein